MKKLLLIFIPFWVFANNPIKETPSTITNATVYLSGAHIERTAKCYLPTGETVFRFTNLSPFIDENSIQISGLSKAAISAMNFNTTYIFAKTGTERTKQLQQFMKANQKEIALIDNMVKGLNEEETLLLNNRKVLSEENASLDKLKQFATYFRERTHQIADEKYHHSLAKDSIAELLETYQNELNVLGSKNKEQKGVLTVTLNTNKPIQLDLHINYNVTNAGWFPVYDIKTASTDSNLDIFFKAHVYQDTGENWDDVAVTLSTADPTVNTENPKLTPHYLNFSYNTNYSVNSSGKNTSYKYNPFVKEIIGIVTDSKGKSLQGATVTIEETSNSTTTDVNGKYKIKVGNGRNLNISYVGFIPEKIPVYNSLINLTLQPDIYTLDDMVLIDKKNKSSVNDALSGYVGGINVVTTNGAPRSSDNIRIRGLVSTNENQPPVYIIDGTPQTSDYFNSLDPNSIKSMQVLKNSSKTSTSLYGSKAANGVIVITTKEVFEKQNITSVEYKIKKHQNISSVMDVTVVDIDQMSVKATYEYVTAPVLNENVFLTATLENWKDLKLLPGECNVYFSGLYVGKTFINPLQTRKDMVVSLGVAPAITVKRTLDNNYKSTPFIGNTRIVDRAYTISLQNTGNKKITVKLLDRIPISQNKEIKVSESNYDADTYDEEKGILEWRIPINAGEHLEKHVSYQIKHPRGSNINLN
ncbi:hypothetical protein NBRC110019_09520 [Neptunitalea chrysea]|uniref:Mucoidy inhibitor MuiA family protein n=1 Tax=Neptunitalea chrysea TaxID=1647581 RepID=A0A9W6B721_9FLAO|nr:mucoidy inhibitor MuiA family protein [Neptunitalea chrysea]GLB51913.1 hypothetical protein NBRC110019_09520 [Neptunitalea chrysea]